MTWRGGWASFQFSIQRPGYLTVPISAGFELDIGPNEEPEILAASAPEHLQRLVIEARRVFHFSTPAGRTVADLRLQAFGAAVLAELTGGALYDPMVNYDAAEDAWNDWSSRADPVTEATRTVDTPAQKAEIEPLPDY